MYNSTMDALDLPPIFDSHLHIIDPRFPLQANQGYLPPAFSCAQYRAQMAPLSLRGGAVVSGSFQGFDQSYLLAALAALGPGFVGVTQLPASTDDTSLQQLNSAGVRALRFNLVRGGSEQLGQLEAMAQRVWEAARWHIELYIDCRYLPDILPRLQHLPAVSIDHLGLSREGLPALLALVEHGAHVKASGFSRGDLDIADTVRQICAVNPEALMFGSDLPSTRAPRAYNHYDACLLGDALDGEQLHRVLADNAINFYRP